MKKSTLVDVHKSLTGMTGILKELRPDTPSIMRTVKNGLKATAMLMKDLEEQGKQYKKA